MQGKIKIVLFSNLFLASVLAVLGVACFYPFGIRTAGKLTDRVYYKGNEQSDCVSLMFNVYWGTEFLPSVLDILDEYDVKTTFFIGGSWADDHASQLKEIVSRGHELGNHGYFHKNQDQLSQQKNADEIGLCGQLVERLTGVKLNLFAPPSGAYSENTVNAADALGYKVILWSKDTIDWRDRDRLLIFRRATEKVVGGDLILAHPTAETVAALPSILQYYREHSLRQVPVSVNIGKEQ